MAFLYWHILWQTNGRNTSRIGLDIGRVGTIALVFAIALLLLWLFRGFGEAIRSFVFDSTIRYNNPSEILSEGTAALMHLNILLLGVALLCISTALLWVGRKLLSITLSLSEIKTRITLIILLLLCIALFALIDAPLQVSLFSAILFIAVSVILVELLLRWNKTGADCSSQKWQVIVWMLLGSFLIGVPILHQKLQQRERREVEATANEYLRPSDSWLTYVVLDGLHTSAEDLANEFTTNRLTTAKESNLAFVLVD